MTAVTSCVYIPFDVTALIHPLRCVEFPAGGATPARLIDACLMQAHCNFVHSRRAVCSVLSTWCATVLTRPTTRSFLIRRCVYVYREVSVNWCAECLVSSRMIFAYFQTHSMQTLGTGSKTPGLLLQWPPGLRGRQAWLTKAGATGSPGYRWRRPGNRQSSTSHISDWLSNQLGLFYLKWVSAQTRIYVFDFNRSRPLQSLDYILVEFEC